LFTVAPSQLQSRYARLTEFEAMLKQYDPTGKFRNDFIGHNLYSS
jgi:xylitol oxidase